MQSPSLSELISTHSPNVALQFSGGRDSLAMLYLMREHWGKLTVYYCNSGDAYPETEALVRRVANMVPNFMEIPGKVHQTRATDGMVSDLIPSRGTFPFNTYPSDVKIVGREVCCYKSIMLPLQAAMRADGIKLILRGQRSSDYPKSPLRSGDVSNGFMVYYPIDDWNVPQVEEYIESQGEKVPAFYRFGMTSAPDCMGCTAWLEHKSYPYLKRFHPVMAREVKINLQFLAIELKGSFGRLMHIAGEQ